MPRGGRRKDEWKKLEEEILKIGKRIYHHKWYEEHFTLKWARIDLRQKNIAKMIESSMTQKIDFSNKHKKN